ncbi:hypothetical protein STEG23_027227, partial [Scotinomys teguina]
IGAPNVRTNTYLMSFTTVIMENTHVPFMSILYKKTAKAKISFLQVTYIMSSKTQIYKTLMFSAASKLSKASPKEETNLSPPAALMNSQNIFHSYLSPPNMLICNEISAHHKRTLIVVMVSSMSY